MKILIADDDSVSLLLLRRTLEKLGHEVDSAKNGVEAFDLFNQQPYGVVISDWIMPELDGIDLARRIRSTKLDRYTYILLLSSRSMRNDKLEALQCGADDFLTKPLDPVELQIRLEIAQRIIESEIQARRRAKESEDLSKRLGMANETLIYTSRRFEELFQGLPVACYSVDHESAIYEWNRAAERLWGHPAHAVVQQSLYELIVPEESRQERAQLVQRVLSGETVSDLELQDKRADGSTRWVLCNMFPLRGPTGEIVGALCANADITSRRENEERLRLLSTVTETSLNGMLITDAHRQVVYLNPAFGQMTGFELADFAGTTAGKLLFGEQSDATLVQTVYAALERQEPIRCEIQAYKKNGEVFWSELQVSPVKDEDGLLTNFFVAMNDISDRRDAQHRIEEQNEQLQALATTDGLTGLMNHRAFQDFLERQFIAARQQSQELSLILLDVDFFKKYNDSFGHQAGDQVLVQVATILKENARERDFVGRYGGEEFVVVLPNADANRAFMLAERLRRGIEEGHWAHREVTVSIGVSTLTPSTQSQAELIRDADSALYASKGAGRNRTTHQAMREKLTA